MVRLQFPGTLTDTFHAPTNSKLFRLLRQYDNGIFTFVHIIGQYMTILLIIRQENDRLRLAGILTTGKKVAGAIDQDLKPGGQPLNLRDEALALFSGIRIINVDAPRSFNYKMTDFRRKKLSGKWFLG